MARLPTLPLLAARTKRRLAEALLILLVLFYAAGLIIAFRVESAIRVPASAAEGIVCQVCQPPGEPIHARCAVVLSYPMEEIWAALTDYEAYGDICSSIHAAQVAHDPSGSTEIKAQGDTFLGGKVPFTVPLDHERQLDRWTVRWSDTGGAVRNRGHWVLTPLQPGETLVELKQQVEVGRVPTFLIRPLLMPRLRETVVALEQRLAHGPSGKSW